MAAKTQDNDFTYQEIIRQQSGWKKAIAHLDSDNASLRKITSKYKDHVWVFSGCGTSYYLAQTASMLFELITGVRCRAIPASEILMYPKVIFNPSDKYLLISLSRSGTTTETVKAAQLVRDTLHLPTLGVSCNPQSPLSLQSDYRLTFPFKTELSVVMTGSFTTMLLSIIYLAALTQNDPEFTNLLARLPDASSAVMRQSESLIRQVAAKAASEDFVFLGQGPMVGIANEAALKMQEMTISVSHGYHALEYRHGPMSTATENTLISILCCEQARIYEIPLAKDLKNLGANVFVLHAGSNGSFTSSVDYEVRVTDEFGDLLKPLLYMPVLQFLAYYKALDKNINPDNPKNLSQVVELNL